MSNTKIQHKLFILILLTSFETGLIASNGQHSIYIIGNRNLLIDNTIYVNFINPDYNAWSKPYNEFSFGAGYSYSLNNFSRIGIHAESEQIKFDNFSIGANARALRFTMGMHFESIYPQKPLHIVGGLFFNFGKLKSDDFEFNLNGIEYGLYIGPELSKKRYDVSFLCRPKYSYFTSSGKDAETVLNLYPVLSIKLSYNFGFKTKEE